MVACRAKTALRGPSVWNAVPELHAGMHRDFPGSECTSVG